MATLREIEEGIADLPEDASLRQIITNMVMPLFAAADQLRKKLKYLALLVFVSPVILVAFLAMGESWLGWESRGQAKFILFFVVATAAICFFKSGPILDWAWVFGQLVRDKPVRDPATGTVVIEDDRAEKATETLWRLLASILVAQVIAGTVFIALPDPEYWPYLSLAYITLLICNLAVGGVDAKKWFRSVASICVFMLVSLFIFAYLDWWTDSPADLKRSNTPEATAENLSARLERGTERTGKLFVGIGEGLGIDSASLRRNRATSTLPTAVATSTTEMVVDMGQGNFDTGIDLRAGDCLKVTATGTYRWHPRRPAVDWKGQEDLVVERDLLNAHRYPSRTSHPGALVGYVGRGRSQPAMVFPTSTGCFPIQKAGRLYLTSNDDVEALHDNDGTLEATISITR